MSSTEWIAVFSALDMAEAQLVAARLSGAGIREVICREAASRGIAVSFGLLARIEIIVPAEEQAAALEALIDLGFLDETDDPA